ncbi:60S ribosomal protein L13a-4-like protein [Cinnamomum micranthum f. kanehirae]|uniref:60S ribosomal protein L13a-4-like protein n=1 Tax=Cinnamomum micranthum f. kanehirae TaxID=337451 RepID=A0A3S3MQ01_9MAGN|nr:60S ribosomal protein L13a-4-like protein [Cinnamomum micranthum f. kanehirae]
MVSGSGICARRVVVDARHHMLGCLASIIAKELLNGQKVVVVRCEEICLSGGLVRKKMKSLRFLRKRMNTKPSHGPIHFRAPAKILWRTIRGACTAQGVRGSPFTPGHKYCLLGRLSSEVGWNYYDIIKELEEKRKMRAKVAHEWKKQLAKLRVKAEKVTDE